MMLGGHSESFRHVVCLRAMRSHLNALNNEKKGKTRMYRNRQEVEDRWRQEEGRPTRSDWFTKGGVTGVLNVPIQFPYKFSKQPLTPLLLMAHLL